MTALVRCITDPACVWSWCSEPTVRRLMAEFGDELAWTWVMGGLERDYGADDAPGPAEMVQNWLEAAHETGMPLDPLAWHEGPIHSTYPACMAVKAAAQQAADGGYAYLRTLREGLMCFRRKLDSSEALVEEARRAGLDVERFRIDLGSHGTVEDFGRDLDEARDVPAQAREAGQTETSGGKERVTFPTLSFSSTADPSERRWVFGHEPYEAYRAAAIATGASPAAAVPAPLEALRRFGRMSSLEVQQVCGLPGPRAEAELWRLASEWQVKPERVMTGHLWEAA